MTRGQLTLTFDDGYSHIRANVLPLLDQHGLPGVFAVPLESASIGHETRLPMAPLNEWQQVSEPHEIAAHGVTHSDLTALPLEKLQHELSLPARELPATSLIYPGGAHNDTVVAQAAQTYGIARTTLYGLNNINPADPMRLKTINYTKRNWSLTRANARALWAVLANKWLIETYHIIEDDSEALHSVPLSEFAAHLQFIAKLPLRVSTLANAVH